MAASAFVILFPNGDYEYDLRQSAAPTIGDKIRRRGVVWSVTSITRGSVATVHVERVDAPAASPFTPIPLASRTAWVDGTSRVSIFRQRRS
jgi:hypothetical protein